MSFSVSGILLGVPDFPSSRGRSGERPRSVYLETRGGEVWTRTGSWRRTVREGVDSQTGYRSGDLSDKFLLTEVPRKDVVDECTIKYRKGAGRSYICRTPVLEGRRT